MATVKVRVSASALYDLDPESYRAEYEEFCEEEGETPEGEVPVDFAIAKFQSYLDDGQEDLGVVLENAPVEVELQS